MLMMHRILQALRRKIFGTICSETHDTSISEFDYYNDAYLKIEQAARISHKSEDKIRAGSHVELVKKLKKMGHTACFEFHDVACLFITDRGISHDLVLGD